jgi:retron-type reverse transcriptase
VYEKLQSKERRNGSPIDLLKAAYSWLKREAAPGVDGRTWQSYKQNLEVNLAELHSRVHRGTYRALPSRRRYIPKPDGRQRPLGIAALEDKIVQRTEKGNAGEDLEICCSQCNV